MPRSGCLAWSETQLWINQKWMKTLIKNQESCVINDGKTTSYFKLERGTRQGHSIWAYLFILTLEVIFALTNANCKVDDLHFNWLYVLIM